MGNCTNFDKLCLGAELQPGDVERIKLTHSNSTDSILSSEYKQSKRSSITNYAYWKQSGTRYSTFINDKNEILHSQTSPVPFIETDED